MQKTKTKENNGLLTVRRALNTQVQGPLSGRVDRCSKLVISLLSRSYAEQGGAVFQYLVFWTHM